MKCTPCCLDDGKRLLHTFGCDVWVWLTPAKRSCSFIVYLRRQEPFSTNSRDCKRWTVIGPNTGETGFQRIGTLIYLVFLHRLKIIAPTIHNLASEYTKEVLDWIQVSTNRMVRGWVMCFPQIREGRDHVRIRARDLKSDLHSCVPLGAGGRRG